MEVIPRKGIVIRPDSLKDMLSLIEARLAMEPNITALAAERATKQQVAGLKKLVTESRRIVDQSERLSFMTLDRAFHALIADSCGQQDPGRCAAAAARTFRADLASAGDEGRRAGRESAGATSTSSRPSPSTTRTLRGRRWRRTSGRCIRGYSKGRSRRSGSCTSLRGRPAPSHGERPVGSMQDVVRAEHLARQRQRAGMVGDVVGIEAPCRLQGPARRPGPHPGREVSNPRSRRPSNDVKMPPAWARQKRICG